MKDNITVLSVVPKDIYFVIELSARQLKMMKDLFDHAQINFDSTQEPEVSAAVEFMEEKLYPFLVDANKYLETGEGDF